MKLLKNQIVKFNQYVEYGATEIDPKRPYGNGDAENDIAKILGMSPENTEDGEKVLSLKQLKICYKIHVETFYCNYKYVCKGSNLKQEHLNEKIGFGESGKKYNDNCKSNRLSKIK